MVLVEKERTRRCPCVGKGTSSIQGRIGKSVMTKQGEVAFAVCSVLVRSHVRCRGQFWAPQCENEVDSVNPDHFRTTRLQSGWRIFPRGEAERAGTPRRQGWMGACHQCLQIPDATTAGNEVKEPGCSQQCTCAGQEASGASENRWSSLGKESKNLSW